MSKPDIGNREYTGFPFGFANIEWEQELRYLTVAQLKDMLEIKRWLDACRWIENATTGSVTPCGSLGDVVTHEG